MSTLGGFLAAAAGPIAKRVLSSIGIGVVTYAGVDLAVNALLSQAKSAWAGTVGDVAAYVAMSGANQALSIIAGAIAARVAFMSLKRLALL